MSSIKFGQQEVGDKGIGKNKDLSLLVEFLKNHSWVLYYFINELDRGSKARTNECTVDTVHMK